MKGILRRRLVLLLVFVVHVDMICEATFCFDHYTKLVKEIREHQSRCSVQVDNSSPCCEAEESSLEERRRNYKILCQQRKFYKIYTQIILDILNVFIASNLRFLMPS